MRVLLSTMIGVAASLWTTACWSTEGLGPGPYTAAETPSQCEARNVQGIVALADAEEYTYLFCTVDCPPEGVEGCPLAEFIARHRPELTVRCIEESSLCALVAVDACPDDMIGFEAEDGLLCYFADDP